MDSYYIDFLFPILKHARSLHRTMHWAVARSWTRPFASTCSLHGSQVAYYYDRSFRCSMCENCRASLCKTKKPHWRTNRAGPCVNLHLPTQDTHNWTMVAHGERKPPLKKTTI